MLMSGESEVRSSNGLSASGRQHGHDGVGCDAETGETGSSALAWRCCLKTMVFDLILSDTQYNRSNTPETISKR
jgi:hypothetical protein